MNTKLLTAIIAMTIVIPLGIVSVDAYHVDKSRGSDDPRIALDGDDAYIVWIEGKDSDSSDIIIAKITGGKTVEKTINITNGESLHPQPEIHVAQNNVYILWEDRLSQDDPDEMYLAASHDYGQTFSEPKKIDPTDESSSFYRPSAIYQINDTLYVFASHWSRATQQNNVIFISSNDFGDTFSKPTILFNHEQSDQEIVVEVHDNTIYVLSDDRNDYDEIGSVYLRKILPDGTLTEIVNVNGGNTTVTHPQLAVSGENVYVSWRDRVFEKSGNGIHERWYQVFTKSHDGGNTFDDVIRFDSDPNSIDTVGAEDDFVHANGNNVYVLWESNYWDGKTQESKIFLAYSQNKGESFDVWPVFLNEKISEHGYITSTLDGDYFHQIAITAKNSPYNDAAVYYSSMNFDAQTKPVDILDGLTVQLGWMPILMSDGDNIHFVAQGKHVKYCILYSFSNDNGKSFSDVVNIIPNGNDIDCLGTSPNLQSPLKQVQTGIDISDAQCKNDRTKGYILALKERDGSPACVASDSYLQLLERNWIKQDSQVTLSLSAAKKFVQSSPTFSFDGIEDSIDLEVSSIRKSIPPAVTIQGTFQTEHPGYGDRTGQEFLHDEKPYSNSIVIEVVQINQIHSAVIDGTWSEIKQKHLHELSPSRSIHGNNFGPTSNIVLTIGDAINSRGMIPIIISEYSENVSGHATFWQFQPIKQDSAKNRGTTWDFLPDDYRQSWGFLDESGNDAWDDSKTPRDRYAIPADGHGYHAFCGAEKVEGESWHPSGIPILPNVKNVVAKSGQLGYYPDSDGIYRLDYIALFDTFVEFPENAIIIENKKELCVLENHREDATHAYHTKLVFKLADFSDNFDETFGGPGNRHPAFLGYDIPKICSNDMVKHLVRYSSMFDDGVPYAIEDIGFGMNADDFDKCVEILLQNRNARN